MPTNGPSLGESGQEQESLQAPGIDAMAAPASKKPVARLRKLVGTVAALAALAAVTGCNNSDETSPTAPTTPTAPTAPTTPTTPTTPTAAPTAPDKTAPSGENFEANANLCAALDQRYDANFGLKARAGGMRPFVRYSDNDGAPRFLDICANPYGGEFVPREKTECANDNGDMDCTVTITGPDGLDYVFGIEDTRKIIKESTLRVLGVRTVGEVNKSKKYGNHPLQEPSTKPIPGNYQIALGLWKKDGVPEEKPAVVKPTPRPATTVVPRKRGPSKKDTEQDRRLAALELTDENQNATLSSHEADIARHSTAIVILNDRQNEARAKIDEMMKGIESHDFESFAGQM